MINIKHIKKYLKNISTNYLIFNIKYTQKELECINNLKVLNHGNFNHFGKIDTINNDGLNNFLSQVSNSSNINILNNIINKLLYNVTKAYDTEYCWMTIRCTLPNSSFDIPRWHKDGPFFVGSDTIQSKFVTVLKGPGTIFIKKSKKVNTIFEKYFQKKRNEYNKLLIKDYNHKIENKYRKILARKLKDEKVNQLKSNQGLIFLSGSPKDNLENGLLHSEPKQDDTRIFISILPGSESEITNLQKRWSK